MFEPQTPRAGDVLLDTDFMLSALSHWSYYKAENMESKGWFSFLDILALFSLAEAVVLNERLLSEHLGDDAQQIPSWEPILELAKKGIIYRTDYIQDYKQSVTSEYCQQVWTVIEDDMDKLARWGWPGADFTLQASFERSTWTTKNGIDHLAWPVFQVLTHAAISTPVQSMMQRLYSKVDSSLRSRVCELRGVGCPIPMYIPPIPAVILERCEGDAKRFFDEAISLREEFQGFRKKYLNYQNLIANPGNLPIRELFQAYKDAVSDVTKQLERTTRKRSDSKLMFEIWNAACEMKAGSLSVDPQATAALNLSALLQAGVKGIEVYKIKAKAKMMFDLWKKVTEIRNYGELVVRTFGIDANELHSFSRVAERLAIKCDALGNVRREQFWEQCLEPLSPE